MHRSILIALASGCIVGGWQAASAAETAPVLTLEIAQKMVAGCHAKATKKGWRVNIAVVDSGANLVMFERMNGAPLGSVTVAQHKAETSAKWPYSTGDWGEWSFGKNGDPALALLLGVVAVAGGLPINAADGTPIGAIGVSGDHPPPMDEECAQAGLDAAKDMLKVAWPQVSCDHKTVRETVEVR